MQKILEELKSHMVENIVDFLPFPEPFTGKGPIKAIVIGADPSTKDGLRFDTVFDLGGNDHRYFAGIEKNLNEIGLTMDNIYVQNFCQNYFTKVTYEQKKNWNRAGGIWYHFLKQELDEKFDIEIPLLATSEIIFKRIIHDAPVDNQYYYDHPEEVPVESNPIVSGRMIFPLYRNAKYNLNKPEWDAYKNKLKEYFKKR